MIEGNRDNYSNRYSKVPFSTLLVTMFCIQYYKGFSVFQTRNLVETAEYILRISNKLSREKKREAYYLKDNNKVVQGKTYKEIVGCYDYMNNIADVDMIAISFDYSYYTGATEELINNQTIKIYFLYDYMFQIENKNLIKIRKR